MNLTGMFGLAAGLVLSHIKIYPCQDRTIIVIIRI